jgi:Xaa-Pro aminopeptidase
MNLEPRTSNLEPSRVSDARLIVASSETEADLYYATRFLAPDPFVFLWHGEEKILLMSDLEVDRARAQAAVQRVLPIRTYEAQARSHGVESPRMIDAVTELLREREIARVVVPGTFPLEHADALRARNIEVAAQPAPFFPERLIKREEEVAAMAEAMRQTEAALDQAIRAIQQADVRDGLLWWQGGVLTSERIKHLIALHLLENGLQADHTIVACGDDGCDPHNQGSGPLAPDQPIIIDVFPRDTRSRYFADITRTVVKGRASAQVRRMYEAVAAGQAAALEDIRDGAPADAVHRKVQATLEGFGFRTGEEHGRMQGFFHGTGHGLGLEIHELPRVSRLPVTLRAGHVVTVEPGLYYLGHGGVRIEDVVVVTDTGCRNLTTYPKTLEV